MEFLVGTAEESALTAAEEAKIGNLKLLKLAGRGGLALQIYSQYKCAQIKLNP